MHLNVQYCTKLGNIFGSSWWSACLVVGCFYPELTKLYLPQYLVRAETEKKWRCFNKCSKHACKEPWEEKAGGGDAKGLGELLAIYPLTWQWTLCRWNSGELCMGSGSAYLELIAGLRPYRSQGHLSMVAESDRAAVGFTLSRLLRSGFFLY